MSFDLFDAPLIDDPNGRNVGSKFGNVAGVSTDVIYPEAKLSEDSWLPGRTLVMKWKADRHRHWLPKSSRAFLELDLYFGEVPATQAHMASVTDAGVFTNLVPQDQLTASKPANHIRLAALPCAAMFDSQVRFTSSNRSIEQSNDFYTTSSAVAATTTNIEGTNTSGSGQLNSLRKDPGVAFGSDYDSVGRGENRHTLLDAAPYITRKDGKILGKSKTDAGATSADSFGSGTVLQDVANLYANGPFLVALADAVAANATSFKVAKRDFERINVGDAVTAGDATVTGVQANMVVISLNEDTQVVTIGPTDAAMKFNDAIAADKLLKIGDASRNPLGNLTVAQLGAMLDARVKPTSYKGTTANPKFQVIQQGIAEDGTNMVRVQISESLVGLRSWQTPYALGPGEYALHATISPQYLKDLFFDPLGQYTCPAGDGGALNKVPGGTAADPFVARQIYCRVRDFNLQIAYASPIEPFVPRSISLKYHPIAVSRQLVSASTTVNTSFDVPASTRSIILCLRNRLNDVCVDTEEISLAGAGITTYGKRGDVAADDGKGEWIPYNKGYMSDGAYTADEANLKKYQVAPWKSLQVQLGNDIQPREMYSELDPAIGAVARPWQDWTAYLSKFHGMRGSLHSFAQYCGYESFMREGKPGAGEVSNMMAFTIRNPSGTMATSLQIRGTLKFAPQAEAGQELVCLAIYDQLWNQGYAPESGSEVPILVESNPLI